MQFQIIHHLHTLSSRRCSCSNTTPIALGADILTSTVDPVYPDPPLPIVSALIVPAADTVAVIAAATGSPEVLTNNASILIGLPTS